MPNSTIQNLYWSKYNLYSNAISGRDSIGGVNRLAVLKASSIECYFTKLSAKEVALYGKRNVIASHRLFCDIRNLISTDLVYIKGKWYQIKYIDRCNRMSDHLEVLLLAIHAPQIVGYSSSSSSLDSPSSSDSSVTESESSKTSSSSMSSSSNSSSSSISSSSYSSSSSSSSSSYSSSSQSLSSNSSSSLSSISDSSLSESSQSESSQSESSSSSLSSLIFSSSTESASNSSDSSSSSSSSSIEFSSSSSSSSSESSSSNSSSSESSSSSSSSSSSIEFSSSSSSSSSYSSLDYSESSSSSLWYSESSSSNSLSSLSSVEFSSSSSSSSSADDCPNNIDSILASIIVGEPGMSFAKYETVEVNGTATKDHFISLYNYGTGGYTESNKVYYGDTNTSAKSGWKWISIIVNGNTYWTPIKTGTATVGCCSNMIGMVT